MEWGENKRVMLHDKTWFLTLTPPPVEKNGPRAPVWWRLWATCFTIVLRWATESAHWASWAWADTPKRRATPVCSTSWWRSTGCSRTSLLSVETSRQWLCSEKAQALYLSVCICYRRSATARSDRWDCRPRSRFLTVDFKTCAPELDMDWIHPWIGLDWMGWLWRRLYLVIIASQLKFFFKLWFMTV